MNEVTAPDVVRATGRGVIAQLLLLALALVTAGVACWLSWAFPPRYFCIALATGSALAIVSNKFWGQRATRVVAALATLSCCVSLYPFVLVRRATAEDFVYRKYFGAPLDREYRVRHVAIASGDFTVRDWVVGRLYYVKDGVITKLNHFGVGRTTNQIPRSVWERRRITLALVDYDTERGHVTQLASAGQSRGGGGAGEIPTSVDAKYAKIVTGPLISGQSRLLYVEGDAPIKIGLGETIGSFAANHDGNFYVVEIAYE